LSSVDPCPQGPGRPDSSRPQIHGHDLFPEFVVGIRERSRWGVQGGVVDQDIEPAQTLGGRVHQYLDGSALTEVDLYGMRRAAGGVHGLLDGVRVLAAAGVVEHHRRPITGQALDDRPPDAAGPAGDHRALAIQHAHADPRYSISAGHPVGWSLPA
jgi:hypothetical protein